MGFPGEKVGSKLCSLTQAIVNGGNALAMVVAAPRDTRQRAARAGRRRGYACGAYGDTGGTRMPRSAARSCNPK